VTIGRARSLENAPGHAWFCVFCDLGGPESLRFRRFFEGVLAWPVAAESLEKLGQITAWPYIFGLGFCRPKIFDELRGLGERCH